MTTIHIPAADWQQLPHLKQQLLLRGNFLGSCCFLDNHEYPSAYNRYPFVWAAGVVDAYLPEPIIEASALNAFVEKHKGSWIFGHICYEAKDALHLLSSSYSNAIGFAVLQFFVPAQCLYQQGDTLVFSVLDPQVNVYEAWNAIITTPVPVLQPPAPIYMQPRMPKQAYLQAIEQLRMHILRGDCYEINYCQEFYAEGIDIAPSDLYLRLVAASPNPFACYYKQGSSHLMCASPERYLRKQGQQLISQPIKGTAPRSLHDAKEDEQIAQLLQKSTKERSENVMVVDLVRNDLSQVCTEGSVKVDELFGLYRFPQVHQMISTVSGTLAGDKKMYDILQATFPMGSMTGAPKLRVMQLIEQYEESARGLYSGSVGYINPEGDFDFNVVIRSLFYNSNSKYLNYWVGGGITWYSNAEKEYQECMLKAEAIQEILKGLVQENTPM